MRIFISVRSVYIGNEYNLIASSMETDLSKWAGFFVLGEKGFEMEGNKRIEELFDKNIIIKGVLVSQKLYTNEDF